MAAENITIRSKPELNVKSSTSPVGSKSSGRKLGTPTDNMQAMEK